MPFSRRYEAKAISTVRVSPTPLLHVSTTRTSHPNIPPCPTRLTHSPPSTRSAVTGPFWVASTLIFVIAFAGNIVDYNNSYMRGEQDAWRYDFGKSTLTIPTFAVSALCLVYGMLIAHKATWIDQNCAWNQL